MHLKNICHKKNSYSNCWGKFRIQQFVTNFIDFQRNNSIFCKTKSLIQKTLWGKGRTFLCSCRVNGEVLKNFQCSQKQQLYNIQSINQPRKVEKFQIISNFCNHMPLHAWHKSKVCLFLKRKKLPADIKGSIQADFDIFHFYKWLVKKKNFSLWTG